MKTDLNCPCCKESVIKSYDDEAKMRAKLIKWDKNGMVAVCKSCSHEVPITAELLKTLQSTFVYEVKED